MVAVAGITDRIAEPSVCWTIVNEAVTELPVVRSVARICAGCVGTFTVACNTTRAVPVASDTTVSDETRGCPGLLLLIPNGARTTSNFTGRLGIPAPAIPVTCTVAVAVSPEHTALVPHTVRLGTTVSPPNNGAGRTVTDEVAVWPIASCTVMTTAVSAVTSPATSTMTPVSTFCATGSTAELLENA